MSHPGPLNNYVLRYLPENLDNILILDCGIGHGEWAFRIRTDPRFNGRPIIVGLDLHEPYLLKQNELGLYDELYNCNVLNIPYQDNFFDIVIASEIIEHLSREDGFKMMDEIERVSRKLVIITTPRGFMKQEAAEGNNHQEHRSGWHSTDFKKRGYSVEIANTRMMTRLVRMVDTMRRVVFNLKRRPDALVVVKTLSKADSNDVMESVENPMSDKNGTLVQHT